MKKARQKNAPKSIEGDVTSVLVWLPDDIHQQASALAKQDGRSLQYWCMLAISEKTMRDKRKRDNGKSS